MLTTPFPFYRSVTGNAYVDGLGGWFYAHDSRPNQLNQIVCPQMSHPAGFSVLVHFDYGCPHSRFSFQCLCSVHRWPLPSHASSNVLHLSSQINLPRLSYFRCKMAGVIAYAFFFYCKENVSVDVIFVVLFCSRHRVAEGFFTSLFPRLSSSTVVLSDGSRY